jgi:hypothetical protein
LLATQVTRPVATYPGDSAFRKVARARPWARAGENELFSGRDDFGG